MRAVFKLCVLYLSNYGPKHQQYFMSLFNILNPEPIASRKYTASKDDNEAYRALLLNSPRHIQYVRRSLQDN